MKALMKKVLVVTVAVAMVLLFAFPIFLNGLSAQTIGWVSNLQVAEKNYDPATDRWTVVWKWSRAVVNESPSMPVGYLLFDEDGDQITPCGGNYVYEKTTWSQSADFMSCPDNWNGQENESGVHYFRTNENHGLQVQPVAIDERGTRIYGEKSEIVFALCKNIETETGIKKVPIKLMRNYPNPFNPITTIHYSVFRQSRIELAVYNLRGERVAKLYNGEQNVGEYSATWNATGFSSGMYFAELRMEPVWDGQEGLSLPDMRIRRKVIKMNLVR